MACNHGDEWCAARACRSRRGRRTGPSCANGTSGNRWQGMSSSPAKTGQHAGSGVVAGWGRDRAAAGRWGTPTTSRRTKIGGAPCCARCCRRTSGRTQFRSSGAWSWTGCQHPAPQGWTQGSCLERRVSKLISFLFLVHLKWFKVL